MPHLILIAARACFSSAQQGLPRAHLDERQEALVEAVAVRPFLPRRRRQHRRQPSQLRHHGQLLRGQPGLDGRSGEIRGCQRRGRPHVAGIRTR